MIAALTDGVANGASIVRMAYAHEETWITVVGRASAITTGFPSAIEAEGWQWDEVPDVPTLIAQPLAPRTVIVVPALAATTDVVASVRQLTGALLLPVIVCGADCHTAVINAVLSAGADDFLPLPITVEEMIARLAAVIRVHFGVPDDAHRSDYRVDDAPHLVSVNGGASSRLSVSEYRLFRMLFAARNRPVARERLAMIPLPHAEQDGPNALDATISRLRRKLGAERIITVRGIGYQLVDHRQPPANVSFMQDALNAR